jgi:F-type H+-transporting ATPase subunit b
MFGAEFWVAAAFVIFVGILIYLGMHTKIVDILDQRAARIKSDLDAARTLKEEALALLTEYKRKQQEAEHEAVAIIAGAKAEAERMTIEATAKVQDILARRTRMAEAKIAQAEAQAVADVRAAAANAAVAAAEKILGRTVKGQLADELISKGIADIKSKLN